MWKFINFFYLSTFSCYDQYVEITEYAKEKKNCKFGVGFAHELLRQLDERFPRYGCGNQVCRLGNLLDPRFQGLHLKVKHFDAHLAFGLIFVVMKCCDLLKAVPGEFEEAKEDLKHYESLLQLNTAAADDVETQDQDMDEAIPKSLSPTERLRRQVKF